MRAALLVISLLLTASGCPTDDPDPTTSCEEDQPCWDCHTMGNKVCGPGERPGKA